MLHLGSVHTSPDIFGNRDIFLRIRPFVHKLDAYWRELGLPFGFAAMSEIAELVNLVHSFRSGWIVEKDYLHLRNNFCGRKNYLPIHICYHSWPIYEISHDMWHQSLWLTKNTKHVERWRYVLVWLKLSQNPRSMVDLWFITWHVTSYPLLTDSTKQVDQCWYALVWLTSSQNRRQGKCD